MSLQPEAASTPTVRVRSRKGPYALSCAQVRSAAVRMLRALERNEAELSVLLVDDASIQKLNLEYRGQDKPTDVLSFPMLEGEFAGVNAELLGDVVISIPTAQRQADRAGRDLVEEVLFLLAHGMLHLMGYDHDTRIKHQEMQKQALWLVEVARMGGGTREARGRSRTTSRR